MFLLGQDATIQPFYQDLFCWHPSSLFLNKSILLMIMCIPFITAMMVPLLIHLLSNHDEYSEGRIHLHTSPPDKELNCTTSLEQQQQQQQQQQHLGSKGNHTFLPEEICFEKIRLLFCNLLTSLHVFSIFTILCLLL